MRNRLPGSFIATGNLPNATTAYKEHPLSSLFSICDGAMQYNDRVFMYGDRLVRVNLNWIRDYMLTVKGFRYTERDLTSFPDLLLEHQHESGFFYEIVAPVTDMHSGVPLCGNPPTRLVEPPYSLLEPGNKFGLCRLELEADIEYLMVEGCELIWQATGDDEWLLRQLPRLERGLQYMMTSPIRWDAAHGLVKRPHTLDTWDFTDRMSSGTDRMIRPEDPMGLFHGDNTGLYDALRRLARMVRRFGDEAKAQRLEETAAGLRERIMRHLWNGSFFRHFLMLDEADYGQDETWQMSLSNSYALNRGILTLEQRKSVLAAYRACREKYKGELDDFRNLEPPFAVFKGMKAGAYVNGANAPFVAGQLATAAFDCGEETYGADILNRIGCKFLRDGKVSFLYDWNENDIGGGPRCWCGAEVMGAMTAGLAGVSDEDKLFRRVTLSPRFAAAGEDHAYVRLEYAASGAAVEYEWRGAQDGSSADFTLVSEHDSCRLRMYLPDGRRPARVTVRGVEAPFRTELVGDSAYAVVENVPTGAAVHVEAQP